MGATTDLLHFDPAQVATLRKLRNGALLPQVLRLFRAEAAQQLAALQAAAAAGDTGTLARAAHAFKSASYSVGARRVGELCAMLETQARGGAVPDAAAAAGAIAEAYGRLLPELESLLQAGTGPCCDAPPGK